MRIWPGARRASVSHKYQQRQRARTRVRVATGSLTGGACSTRCVWSVLPAAIQTIASRTRRVVHPRPRRIGHRQRRRLPSSPELCRVQLTPFCCPPPTDRRRAARGPCHGPAGTSSTARGHHSSRSARRRNSSGTERATRDRPTRNPRLVPRSARGSRRSAGPRAIARGPSWCRTRPSSASRSGSSSCTIGSLEM